MAIKYLSGKRLQGTSAERTSLNLSSPPATSWKELGRTTSTSTSSTIEVTGFTAKDNIMILGHQICNTDHHTTYSTGTGSYSGNYSDRRSENGGSEATTVNRTTNGIISDALTKDTFIVGEMVNITGQEKLVNWDMVGNNTAGVNNVPDRYETVGKFTGSAQINRMKFNNSSSVNNEIGSEIVILGCDNDEADSGTNFWQELASGTASGGSLTSGTFTAKKYLMVVTNLNASSNAACAYQFNDDTGANYNTRFSEDGGSDQNWKLTGGLAIGRAMSSNSPAYQVSYIVNKSDKEKLTISEDISNKAGTGAGNAPKRQETVGKWTKTDQQITKINIVDSQGINNTPWLSGSTIKVYGAD